MYHWSLGADEDVEEVKRRLHALQIEHTECSTASTELKKLKEVQDRIDVGMMRFWPTNMACLVQ